MRKYILLFLLIAFTLNATAQTQITRKPKKEQSAPKPKPKPANKPAAKPKPKPTPAPTPASTPAPRPAAPVEAAGYDVTFSCNAPGARIVVDGTSIVSDADSLFLRTGSHTLRVTAGGYEDYSSSFSVNSSHRTCSISMTKKRIQNKTFTVGGVSFNMVYVAGGTFQMGSNVGDYDEKPVHSVTLSDYYIGQTEVTQELWQAVMGSNPSFYKDAKNPVNYVNWNDCQEFISKLNRLTGGNFRLPTEAEWEYAARGGNKSRGYKYSGSDDLGSVAWNEDNSGKEVHPVGSKSANELGLYDMSGNVWEWCSDRYDYCSYPSSPQTNPTGPSSGSFRVLRGGSYYDEGSDCRSANRTLNDPTGRYSGRGLRLAY